MELVIFSNWLSVAAMSAAVLLYLIIALSKKFLPENKILTSVLAAVNAAVHIIIFFICVYLKASAEEMLFILIVSAALAITVSAPGKEEKK